MKKSRILGAVYALTILFFGVTGVQASLIGDTVDVIHYFPDSVTVENDLGPTTGAIGTSDVVTYTDLYNVDLEANSILVDFFLTLPGDTFNPATFNGLVVSAIDDPVNSVSIDTNLVGWNDSRMSFSNSSVSFNWESLPFDGESYFNATINPVPIPAALWLFGSGLLGLAGIARLKKAA